MFMFMEDNPNPLSFAVYVNIPFGEYARRLDYDLVEVVFPSFHIDGGGASRDSLRTDLVINYSDDDEDGENHSVHKEEDDKDLSLLTNNTTEADDEEDRKLNMIKMPNSMFFGLDKKY